MELYLPKDQFDNYCPPRLFLCTTGGKRMQELNYYDGQLKAKWNSYSELSFSIDRTYVDMIDGKTKVHPAFDKAESLRLVLVDGIGYFILQDNDDTYSDKDSKSLSAFSLEYALGTKYIEHFLVNKGSEDSQEVIYLSTIYGDGYTVDINNLYKLASGDYNAYQDYYMCSVEDTDKYEQVQVQESEYSGYIAKNNSSTAQPYEKLYVKSYPNVSFYNQAIPELSLLHLVMSYIPDWSIGNVDTNLWSKERSFEINRTDVYSFLTNDIADTFKCVVSFDTLNKKINFYEEADDGLTDDGQVLSRWDTDIYISRDNLANEVNIKVSGDNIKTKLKVSGGDKIDVSEVNLGKSYIMNLDYYHNEDWMEQDLIEAYNDYLEAQELWAEPYEETVQGVLAAQDKYNDMLYNVAVETNVLLVKDEFKKLFCLYEPIDNAYYNGTITSDTTSVSDLYITDDKFSNDAYKINKNNLFDKETFIVQGYRFLYNQTNDNFDNYGTMVDYSEKALLKQLALYHVNEDTEANETDNILLTLRHPDKHEATIRIFNTYEMYAFSNGYNDKYNYYMANIVNGKTTYREINMDNEAFNHYRDAKAQIYVPHYQIKLTIINASGGTQTPNPYELSQWLNGELTAEAMNLTSYIVTSIGTMGAYFVLAKDEKQEANIEDYGINQLQEKYDTYLKLFLTQTENMLSNTKNECIAADEEPTGTYLNGTRWLDTNSRPATLMEYKDGAWVSIDVENDENRDAQNYARYLENYNKMTVVQEMLVKKKKESEYCKYGYEVPITKPIIDSTGATSVEENIRAVALSHFGENATIAGELYYTDDWLLYMYFFTTSADPIVYTPNLDAYDSRTQYYVQDSVPGAYLSVNIETIADFNDYDGSSPENTLYVRTGHEYAVYMRSNTPYVAYKDSEGVWQAKREYISKKTDIESFLNKDQMTRLSPLIREDVYEDSNFFFNSYESNEEEVKILKELMADATKELKTLSQPSFEFSMTMANILALPEFENIVSQFALGNFIRIELLSGKVKRSRLLECDMGLNDLSDFSCTFGNLVTTKSEIDLHAELLSQAISAGKAVAAARGAYQATVDTVNKLDKSISNGLRDVALRVSEGSGQAISWDSTGMHFRKYKPGSTTEYEPEEMAIINNALVATNDSWKTSKAAFGKYTIDGVERWGPIAEYVTADTIEGKFIKGGAIQIGDEDVEGGSLFKVDEKGEVMIISNGVEKYASKLGVDAIQSAYQYTVELVYNGSTVFGPTSVGTIVTALVKDYGTDITHQLPIGTKFTWLRNGVTHTITVMTDDNKPTANVINIHTKSLTANQIYITADQIDGNSYFSCRVDFDETNIQKGE